MTVKKVIFFVLVGIMGIKQANSKVIDSLLLDKSISNCEKLMILSNKDTFLFTNVIISYLIEIATLTGVKSSMQGSESGYGYQNELLFYEDLKKWMDYLNCDKIINKETEFIYSKDRFTQRVCKKLHYFVLYNGEEYELKKIRDSSNTVRYLIPSLPDSALLKIKEDGFINIRIKFKKQCFETKFFNVVQGYKKLAIEIKNSEKNVFKRKQLVFLQVNGIKPWCPPVYTCGLIITKE